ncbi:hypothetical protein Tco_1375095 [Tanacetum coccineum]
MLQELEMEKQEFEKKIRNREMAFEKQMQRELENLKKLRDYTSKKMKKLKTEREQFERENHEVYQRALTPPLPQTEPGRIPPILVSWKSQFHRRLDKALPEESPSKFGLRDDRASAAEEVSSLRRLLGNEDAERDTGNPRTQYLEDEDE